MRYISFFFIWVLASLVRIEETVGTDWPCPALASRVFFSHIWDNRILDNTILGLFIGPESDHCLPLSLAD